MVVRVKIMTYNVHSCIDMQKKSSLNRIIELMGQEKPGIVGLNEIESFTLRTGFANQPKRLAAARNLMFRYGPTIKLGPLGFFGNAVLSRYPIYKTTNLPLPELGEKRCCLRTTVTIPSGFLTVLVTHLGLDRKMRDQQIASIKELVKAEKNPVVLMGDFNCGVDQMEPLYELLTDTGRLHSAKPTFPFPNPSQRIDYILTSPELKCTGARVVFFDASDHLPLVSEIEI